MSLRAPRGLIEHVTLSGGSIRDPVERSPAQNINLKESPACWLIHCNSLQMTGDE
jgi:hypothetical protein